MTLLEHIDGTSLAEAEDHLNDAQSWHQFYVEVDIPPTSRMSTTTSPMCHLVTYECKMISHAYISAPMASRVLLCIRKTCRRQRRSLVPILVPGLTLTSFDKYDFFASEYAVLAK